MEAIDALLARCESEAERAFVRGIESWRAATGFSLDMVEIEGDSAEHYRLGTSNPDDPLFLLEPQVKVGRYRLDFQIVAITGSLSQRWRYDIEIDGHAWHERTHAEAAQQRRRDRFMLTHSIVPIRFAAIEVLDNPHACVCEALDTIAEIEASDMDFAADEARLRRIFDDLRGYVMNGGPRA